MGATGVPLGLLPGHELGGTGFALRPGDVLVLYSDGVSEAQTGVWTSSAPSASPTS